MTNEFVEEFVPNDSSALQEESLVLYMEAMGYDPVYTWGHYSEVLVGFRSDKYIKDGVGRVSVNTAIQMHNNESEICYNKVTNLILSSSSDYYYKDFISNRRNYMDIVSLFAGTCKIVEQVKGCGSKKRGLIIHDHTVKFMSNKYKQSYGHWIGINKK